MIKSVTVEKPTARCSQRLPSCIQMLYWSFPTTSQVAQSLRARTHFFWRHSFSTSLIHCWWKSSSLNGQNGADVQSKLRSATIFLNVNWLPPAPSRLATKSLSRPLQPKKTRQCTTVALESGSATTALSLANRHIIELIVASL